MCTVRNRDGELGGVSTQNWCCSSLGETEGNIVLHVEVPSKWPIYPDEGLTWKVSCARLGSYGVLNMAKPGVPLL